MCLPNILTRYLGGEWYAYLHTYFVCRTTQRYTLGSLSYIEEGKDFVQNMLPTIEELC